MNRRHWMKSVAGLLVAAPAVVSARNLMPVVLPRGPSWLELWMEGEESNPNPLTNYENSAETLLVETWGGVVPCATRLSHSIVKDGRVLGALRRDGAGHLLHKVELRDPTRVFAGDTYHLTIQVTYNREPV